MIDLAHTIGLKYNYFNKGVIVGAKLNLIGKKFNRLLVLEEDFSKKREWCVIHCRDWWCLMGPEKWLFGNKEEATQFYMTWADNEV